MLHVAHPSAPFAPFSLAAWVARRSPPALATTAIDTLGHNALRILASAAIAGAFALAVVLRGAPPAAVAAIAGTITAGAAVVDPTSPSTAGTVAAAAVAAGAVLAVRALARPSAGPAAVETTRGRRQVLVGGGLLVGAAVLGVQAARRATRHVTAALVRADRPATVPRDRGFAAVDGLSPVVTSRADHYTVDVDIEDPVVDAGSWRLRVHGAVGHDLELSLADLRALPTVERLAALSCISNPVGGHLVGNSRWTGVPVRDLLRLARLHDGATSIEARGADGYAETLPLAAVLGGDALVAFAMNGALLPRRHGFPARLRVPSRYGVKNVKWLTDLVVLEQAKLGYWGARGWDRDAVVRTQSRIDTPRHGDRVPRRFTTAGIAWAGDRRISRVEVSTDDGATWRAAELEREADVLSWRRWKLDLTLPPGDRAVVVRTVDGAGDVQAEDRAPPHPSGATGWHRVVVTVADGPIAPDDLR